MKYDYLIVGAGFSGCTLAERLANVRGKKILLVERREHTGGQCYDHYNAHGILVKPYGPHIFHTKIKEVWEYVNRFTSFNNYVHRVIANVKGKEVYFPINLDTMEKLTGREFTPETLRAYFEEKRIKIDKVKNSRDVVLSQVGEELYELFVKQYSKKQWGLYPEELDASVLRRIPVRYNRDTRYFDDVWQGIPVKGYHKIFELMLVSPRIEVLLKTDYKDILDSVRFDRLIYTGPIDYFFDYLHGKLPYRSLRFKFETLDVERFQSAAVVNYTSDKDYTRITEFKHFYLQEHPKTTICYEYPTDEGDPYYPIPREENHEIYLKYKAEADKLKNTYFTGRLAEYKYLNMDIAVSRALNLFEKF
jgi:UDP-galactopyranose mutase